MFYVEVILGCSYIYMLICIFILDFDIIQVLVYLYF